MKLEPYQTVLRPLVTEKGHRFNARKKGRQPEVVRNKYAFEVAPDVNKHQIRDAVEVLYDVKVHSVNTMCVPGKTRRVGGHTGKTREWKKAVITLKEGHAIELY